MQGRIFDIQRFSIHDGPGIRTTVFLQGCPLNCLWCHNPEGIVAKTHLACTQDRCTRCGACVKVCPNQVHSITDQEHRIDRSRCTACGACVEACPSGALELIGRVVDSEEVLAEVAKDAPFYKTSGGGLTLSGGEPLAQSAFSLALLQGAKNAGFHTAVETSGFGRQEDVLTFARFTDLFLFDLKQMNPERHQALTRVDSAKIFANLRTLDAAGAKIRLRLPIIPGCNDDETHLSAVSALAQTLSHVEGIEVMPYHRLGGSKRSRLGLAEAQDLPETEPETADRQRWEATLEAGGARVIRG